MSARRKKKRKPLKSRLRNRRARSLLNYKRFQGEIAVALFIPDALILAFSHREKGSPLPDKERSGEGRLTYETTCSRNSRRCEACDRLLLHMQQKFAGTIVEIMPVASCIHCNSTGEKRRGRLLFSLPLQVFSRSRLIARALMRRCCCRSGGWWLRSDSSLTRCGRSRLGFARTGGQHHREHRERRSNNNQFFHSME